MTDRHAGYVVTLATDIRDDEDQAIITALEMVKGVVSVKPLVSTWEVHVAEQRADAKWREKIYSLVSHKPGVDP